MDYIYNGLLIHHGLLYNGLLLWLIMNLLINQLGIPPIRLLTIINHIVNLLLTIINHIVNHTFSQLKTSILNHQSVYIQPTWDSTR